MYVDKIKTLCALLAASGSPISEAERTAVLLAGLSSEFDAIVSHASLFPVPLPFQRLIDALSECEALQIRSVQDVLVAANVVEGTQLPSTDGAFRGGRPLVMVVAEAFVLASNVKSAADLVISRSGVTTAIIVRGSRRWKHGCWKGAMVVLLLVRTGKSLDVRIKSLCMVKIGDRKSVV